jgi:hypothetical protein
MGMKKGTYNCEFPRGTIVRVATLDFLERFQREWKYHNKLASEQLDYAGRVAPVASASVYHGGGELYELEGIPGVWHEQCLELASTGG